MEISLEHQKKKKKSLQKQQPHRHIGWLTF